MEGEKVKKEKKEPKASEKIEYSEKYYDAHYEYRHVILPKDITKHLPQRVMTEMEWRALGVQQSRGWEHYTVHRPEPHILLFRRPHGTNPNTGTVDPFVAACAKKEYSESLDAAVYK